MMRSSLGLYLRYALMATTAVVVVPVAVVVLVALSARGSSVYIAAAVGAGVSLAATLIGSHWWSRRPEAVDVSFGELMLWRFLRRKRAEEQIDEGAQVLGLDRKGRPLKRMPLTRSERLEVLQHLATALETKDPYTHGHSTRVERLVSQTAAVLELSEEETVELCTAAALHDVGKIRIPASILRKPERLTIDEQLIVQEHASIGAWMVAGVSNGSIVASVKHHHERWDGNGYPDGLSGDDIPLFARIIAVADAYDAMTSTRPYRPSLDRRQAIEELQNQSGRQFDPAVVDAFLHTAPRKIPLPAILGLGLIGRMLRRATAWATRTGAAGAGPGVASVGAASILVASVFAPPAALTRPTPPGKGMLANAPRVSVGEWDLDAAAQTSKDASADSARSTTSHERAKTKPDKQNPGKSKKHNGPRVLGSVIERSPEGGDDPSGTDNDQSPGGPKSDPGKDDPDGNEPPGKDHNPPGPPDTPGTKPDEEDPEPDDDDDDGGHGETKDTRTDEIGGGGHGFGHDKHDTNDKANGKGHDK